jgi:predicted  nucleic acid-binding Zn-ribbon protein
MPVDSKHYLIEAAGCSNCGAVSEDLVIAKGTSLCQTPCPACGCRQQLWRMFKPEPESSADTGLPAGASP